MTEQALASKILIRGLTASTIPQKICSKDKSRKRLYVQVTDSNTAYVISEQNQVYTGGIKVTASLPYENVTSTAELWILTSSSTTTCVIEQDTD